VHILPNFADSSGFAIEYSSLLRLRLKISLLYQAICLNRPVKKLLQVCNSQKPDLIF
jgi:hypothetical protein